MFLSPRAEDMLTALRRGSKRQVDRMHRFQFRRIDGDHVPFEAGVDRRAPGDVGVGHPKVRFQRTIRFRHHLDVGHP